MLRLAHRRHPLPACNRRLAGGTYPHTVRFAPSAAGGSRSPAPDRRPAPNAVAEHRAGQPVRDKITVLFSVTCSKFSYIFILRHRIQGGAWLVQHGDLEVPGKQPGGGHLLIFRRRTARCLRRQTLGSAPCPPPGAARQFCPTHRCGAVPALPELFLPGCKRGRSHSR
mgnify:CR=1 FL=1